MAANDDFAARLARVQANKGQSVIMVGQDESFVHRRKEVVQVARHREVAGNLLYPASLAGAFVLGMIAVAMGYYARFHIMSGHSELPDADLEMALTAFIGICTSFALAQMFKITSKEHKALQSAGIFMMVAGFHNLFFWAPGVMAVAFSPEYVVQTTLYAEPNSLRYRGVYIPFAETTYAVAEAPLPTESVDQIEPTAAVAAPCTPSAPAVKKLTLTGERHKSAPSDDALATTTCPEG